MKKLRFLFFACIMLLFLAACGGGNIEKVEIPDWKPSEIYTDHDIETALQAVKEYFAQKFDGCTLTKLYYPGDTHANEFEEWAASYEADEAIVIYSNFDVGASGGDGTFEPNSTYTDWQWVFVRSAGGNWEHVTHGYG